MESDKKDKYNKYVKEYRKNPEVKKKRALANKKWLEKNKNYYNDYMKDYRQKENYKQKHNASAKRNYIRNKLTRIISTAIYNSLKGKKYNIHWEKLVDYTLNELKEHLEKQFKPWMNWENHGKTSTCPKQTWQIDHIRPVNTFNIVDYDSEDFKKCWSLENLRPLDSYINVRRPFDGND